MGRWSTFQVNRNGATAPAHWLSCHSGSLAGRSISSYVGTWLLSSQQFLEQLRRPCRPRHPYAVPEKLLFSASVLGAAIALHNCRHPGEYALRTCRFSSPDLTRFCREPLPSVAGPSNARAEVERLPAHRKNGGAAPCPLSADTVAKVILGCRMKILRAADALTRGYIQNRSRTSVVALKNDPAAEKFKDRLSRDFWVVRFPNFATISATTGLECSPGSDVP